MASQLPRIAKQLGADERTLRRAAHRGTVRARRPSPRRLELAPGELAYLRSHWELLSNLTRAFRTEPNVSLAVLYGSTARGDDHAGSDVDVLVAFRDDESASVATLANRLGAVLGTTVDVARFSRVRKQSPLLLLQAIDEGRVLIDRAEIWPHIVAERETVARAARRQLARERDLAVASIASLIEDN